MGAGGEMPILSFSNQPLKDKDTESLMHPNVSSIIILTSTVPRESIFQSGILQNIGKSVNFRQLFYRKEEKIQEKSGKFVSPKMGNIEMKL